MPYGRDGKGRWSDEVEMGMGMEVGVGKSLREVVGTLRGWMRGMVGGRFRRL